MHNDNWQKIILDLCGGTGSWSAPYREAGYQTIVIDPSPANDLPDGMSFRGTVEQWIVDAEEDARRHGDAGMRGAVHGVLAAPECTDFTVSGSQHWKDKDDLGLTQVSIKLVVQCLYVVSWVKPKWWALENPVGRMRSLVPQVGQPQPVWRRSNGKNAMSFNPNEFAGWADDPAGDSYTKRTQLFGSFNMLTPDERPITHVKGSSPIHRVPPGPLRKQIRSKTPQGFARAFFNANP